MGKTNASNKLEYTHLTEARHLEYTVIRRAGSDSLSSPKNPTKPRLLDGVDTRYLSLYELRVFLGYLEHMKEVEERSDVQSMYFQSSGQCIATFEVG